MRSLIDALASFMQRPERARMAELDRLHEDHWLAVYALRDDATQRGWPHERVDSVIAAELAHSKDPGLLGGSLLPQVAVAHLCTQDRIRRRLAEDASEAPQ